MKKIIKQWKWVVGGLFVVVLIALFLRIYNLTILPVFADEAIYIRWAQIMKNEPTLRFLPLSDGKQPLYMWVVIPFLKIFSNPLVSGRMLSVFSGIGTLVGIFVLSFILFENKKVSLLSSAIYALSPFPIFFDRMALVDSLLSFFGIWVLTFSVLVAKHKRLDLAMILGFFLGGALLTKSPAIFFVILLLAGFVFIKKKIDILKISGLYAVSLLIGYGMYNILRLGPNFHLIGSRTADYVFPISHLWLNPKDPFIFLIDRSFEWVGNMGPWPILILGILALLNYKKYFKEVFVLVSWFLFPILVQSMFAKVYTARYIFFTLPSLFVLAGSVLLLKNNLIKKIFFGVLALFVGFSVYYDFFLLTDPAKANLPRSERSGYLEEWTAGQGIKEISEYLKIEQDKDPSQKIIVGTEGYFGTLPDGLQMYLYDKPEITVIGVGLLLKEIPEQLVNAKKVEDRVFLVVNDSRIDMDYQENGLNLISSYQKEKREEGTKEYVQKGPQEHLLFFELE